MTSQLFPALHIGAHCGTVLYRQGDYFGGTVNLAARVASAAAGQFLITEDLHDAAGNHSEVDFVALPPRRLKGIPDPICLTKSRQRISSRSNRAMDPVCTPMMLQPKLLGLDRNSGSAVSHAGRRSPTPPAGSLPQTQDSRSSSPGDHHRGTDVIISTE